MKRTYFAIFLISCSALIFEVSLIRFFSIYLSHHFAFMVISIAMLGIGSAGTALSVFARLRNKSNITVYAALAGIAIIFGYIASNNVSFDPVKLSWDGTQILYIALYCFVLSIPFFFTGILIATAFSTQSEKSEFIYSADLFGAGIGSLSVLGFLNLASPEYAILTASLLCFIASFVTDGKNMKWFVSFLIIVNVLLLIIHPDFINIKLSPYKNLSLSLKYPGAKHLRTYYNSFSRIDSLKSPAVRFAPGLSLTYLDPLPEQIGLSVDGSEMNAVTKAEDKNSLRFLKFLPSALAYEILTSQKNTEGNKNVIARSSSDSSSVIARSSSDSSSVIARSSSDSSSVIARSSSDSSSVIARHEVPKQSQDKLGTVSAIFKDEILRGVYPERKAEILHFVQNDKRRVQNDMRRAQNDKLRGFSHEIKEKDNNRSALIIEPKGGLQALIAEYYGFKNIHKVESNSLLVKIIKNDFREFSGKIFENDTWTGFGRSYLRSLQFTVHSSRFYDIIDLPMTAASVSGAFGISEDYRFTIEAFKDYLNALKRDGFISVSLYLIPPPRTEPRILTTIITALEQTGIKDTSGHIAAIRSWDSITILAKKSPLNEEEINLIKKFSRDKRFDLVYYPGVKEEETNLYVKTPTNEYFNLFKNIITPESRELFIKNYLFNITPAYDDKPFFNYYLKLKNIKAIYEIMGHKWQYFIQEGYLIPVIFIQVFILSFILILLPVGTVLYPFSKGGQRITVKMGKRELLPALTYFAMLGLGFMFVEVTMIQKSILPLENPSYAFATVLTAILISSGLGSFISSGLPKLKIRYFLLLLGVLIFLYSIILPLFLNIISSYSLAFKIPMVFIVLTPLGFFMGIPFPMGMKLLGQKNEALIPWAWAVNGCLSVLAPILTIMLAMTAGFKIALWLGAIAYLLAFVSLKKLI